MIIFVPDSPVFIIMVFVVLTTTTTANTIRVNAVNTNISIENKFTERIRVNIQLFIDLFAVQYRPTGRRPWDGNYREKYCRPFKNLL